MSEIHLLKINYNDKDFSFIQDIRKSVFKDELQISEAELFDDFDNSCDHFLIFDGKNIVKEFRTKNYGKKTISQILEYYTALGFSQIFLDSINSVKEFYKKCGFIEEGDIFQRVGIDHIRMFSKF